ncbi:MAG: tetratricopeptide repeat protein [Planctomycetota bacterium]|nr:tetratricopeptide repeat protein [Planctomycetota bacterium]
MLSLLFCLPLVQDPGAEAERLWAEGRRVEAVDRNAAELARRPDDAELRALLVERELEIHRYAAALEHAALLGPDFDDERGFALYWLGRYEEALARLDSDLPDQTLLVVDACEALGLEQETARAIEKAADVLGRSDPRVLTWRGKVLASEGDHARAGETFRAALAQDPHLPEALFGLGRALVRSGKRDEGLAVLRRHRELVPLFDQLVFARKSLDLNPLHAPGHARVGDVERAIGRIDRALEAYRRAESLAEIDQVVPIALRHARLQAEDRGDVEAALRVLRLAELRVTDVRLIVRAGSVLLAAKRPAEAVRELERALGLDPGDEAIRSILREARADADDERKTPC